MHKRAAFSSVFILFTVAVWAQELPQAITSYYEDWNYVASNSTGHQRAVLWSAYQRRETAVLSGSEQEILVRMQRIVDATESRHFSMPMMLAGTQSPVSSELLVPSDRTVVGGTEILVQVKVMQLLIREAPRARAPVLPIFESKPRFLSMCQYTDKWIRLDGSWKVRRSPAVWVGEY